MTSSPGFGDDVCKIFHLCLGTSKGTKPLLRQLTGTLVLAVSEQFNDTTLVWCEASNLFDDLPHESGPLAQVTLRPRWLWLRDSSLGLVAFVQADGQAGLFGTFFCHRDD